MNITDDITKFTDVQYNIGYLTALEKTDDAVWELSVMISDYITELFNESRNGYVKDIDNDGCAYCKHIDKKETEFPCVKCKQNYHNMWENENDDQSETERE